jgi:hypothetical protein
MQKLIFRKSKFDVSLQTINIDAYNGLEDSEKLAQIKIKAKQLVDYLSENKVDLKIELGENPASERTVRYLNRMIRTIRKNQTTLTNIVVEVYETILSIKPDHKSIHREINTALDGQVPVSSIRRIISLYRNGKLG